MDEILMLVLKGAPVLYEAVMEEINLAKESGKITPEDAQILLDDLDKNINKFNQD